METKSDVSAALCPVSSQSGGRPSTSDSTEVQIETDSSERSSLASSLAPLLDSKCKFRTQLEKLHLAGPHSIVDNEDGCHGSREIEGGSVLSFHDISYQVAETVKGCCCCAQKRPKAILSNVSGLFKPGMNAILGPTGSGKTSLLDALAGRKDPKNLSGSVRVNGSPLPDNFKCMAGYVIQDDIVTGMLTVRENIAFSAALRLSSSMSADERNNRVEDIIIELGLGKCADTRVGTEFVRGVSGGERKRTNIAMELVTAPQILFLDEPTTGLDAYTAYSVMHLLRRLSRRGRTIIFSIHQPRFAIFRLIDELMLLLSGHTVYHGPASEALDHFSSIGFHCEEHNNPPDFFLDILNGSLLPRTCPAKLPPDVVKAGENSVLFKDSEAETLALDMDEDDTDMMNIHKQILAEQYSRSKYQERVKQQLDPLAVDDSGDPTRTDIMKVSYSTSFFAQFYHISLRTWKNMVRNRHTLMTQMMSAILLGMVIGGIYFNVDLSFTSGIQNRVGAFFFMVMNYVFGNMSAVDVFIKDRAIFIHESVSGFYRVSSFFLAKFAFDVLPQRAIPVCVFASISYWMIGLTACVSHFFFFMLNLFLTCMAGTSVALVFSASTRNHTVGTIFTALVWVFMMVFSGLLVNIQTIPSWLRWVQWISIFRFSMNGFTVNELKDLTFCDHRANGTTICDSGNDYMERQGIPYETTWDLWQNEVALAAITMFFLILTYIKLRSMEKLK